MKLVILYLVMLSAFTSSYCHADSPFKLECRDGPEVLGPNDGWSQVSLCPQGFLGMGLSKLDLEGPHHLPTIHVNDLRCTDQGCKAYCIGTTCRIKSRCCRIGSVSDAKK